MKNLNKAYKFETKAKEYTQLACKLMNENNDNWVDALKIALRFKLMFDKMYNAIYSK